MKKTFKRVSALLLAVLMVCMMLPTSAFAATIDETLDGVNLYLTPPVSSARHLADWSLGSASIKAGATGSTLYWEPYYQWCPYSNSSYAVMEFSPDDIGIDAVTYDKNVLSNVAFHLGHDEDGTVGLRVDYTGLSSGTTTISFKAYWHFKNTQTYTGTCNHCGQYVAVRPFDTWFEGTYTIKVTVSGTLPAPTDDDLLDLLNVKVSCDQSYTVHVGQVTSSQVPLEENTYTIAKVNNTTYTVTVTSDEYVKAFDTLTGRTHTPITDTAAATVTYVNGEWTASPDPVVFNVTCEDPEPETITVKFVDGAEGDVFPDEEHQNVPVRESGDYTDLFEGPNEDGKVPTRDGYTFTAWDKSVDENGNVTYTAQWEEVPPTPTPTVPPIEPLPSLDPGYTQPTPTIPPIEPLPSLDPGYTQPTPTVPPIEPLPSLDPGYTQPTPTIPPIEPLPDLDLGFGIIPKTVYPGIEKIADTSDLTLGEVSGKHVFYELISTIPENLKEFLKTPEVDVDEPKALALDWAEKDGEYFLVFKDKLPDGMIFDDNVTLLIDGITQEMPMVDDDGNTIQFFTVTYGGEEDDYTFAVSVDLVALFNAGIITVDDLGKTPISVTYSASFDEDVEPGHYTNNAWVEYPNGEETEGSAKASATVEVYAVNIVKYDQKDQSKHLAGAEFGIYASEADAKAETNAIKTATTGENGELDFSGLAAGTYYLKELTAPEGYVKSDSVLPVEIPGDADESNIVHVTFANAEAPHTGGAGTMMFTVSGFAMTLLALGYWVMTRKQREHA